MKLEAMDANGVRELMRNDSNSLRLVNIWATWCGPCVVEFPALVEMNRMYRGREFEMVTLSVDAPEKREGVLAFLKQRQASCRNYHYSSTEREALFAAVGRNWEGVLPCTLIIKPGGEVVYSQEGVIDPLETRRAIVGELGRYFFK